MTAIAEAYQLERTLGSLYKVEAALIEDMERAFPVRLFRKGRQIEAEPALERVFTGVSKALADHPRLPEVMAEFDTAYRQAMGPLAKREVALNKLSKARSKWGAIRDALMKEDRAATENLVAWVERDVEERMAIARARSGKATTATESVAKRAKLITRSEVEVEKRLEETKRVYEAFLTAMMDSQPDLDPAFKKLAAYLGDDNDPVWGRIAAKLGEHRPGTQAEELSKAIHGIIGEALAMKNAWVVDAVVRANERASQLAAKLGTDWEVVMTQLPVLASTKSGGMGELYDASVWVVNKSTGETAPVFVLQVKAGKVSEAADQIGKDFTRELGDKVRLPAAGMQEPRTYKISNLKKVLDDERVKLGKGAKGMVGDGSTHRVLVAPRPPSDASLKRALPRGVAIDYVESVLSKRESLGCSLGLAKAWRKK
jgi:hypothetical protein